MLSLVQPSLAVQSSLALCAASQLPVNPQFQPAEYIEAHLKDFVTFSKEISLPNHAKALEQLQQHAERVQYRRDHLYAGMGALLGKASIALVLLSIPNIACGIVLFSDWGRPDLFFYTLTGSILLMTSILLVWGGLFLFDEVPYIPYSNRSKQQKAEQELRDYLNTIPAEILSQIVVEFAQLKGEKVPPLLTDDAYPRAVPHKLPEDK